MGANTIKQFSGLIQRDKYGSWSDCSPGLYIDSDMIESIFNEYKGKTIEITIEEIEEQHEDCGCEQCGGAG